MKDKLRAWIIHKLGGFTRAEMERNDAERQKQIDAWEIRYNALVNEYGKIETISTRRTIDAFALHEYESEDLRGYDEGNVRSDLPERGTLC